VRRFPFMLKSAGSQSINSDGSDERLRLHRAGGRDYFEFEFPLPVGQRLDSLVSSLREYGAELLTQLASRLGAGQVRDLTP
jgi:hypothetical protein